MFTKNIKKGAAILSLTAVGLTAFGSINAEAAGAVVTVAPSTQTLGNADDVTLTYTSAALGENDVVTVQYDDTSYTGTPTATVEGTGATVDNTTGGTIIITVPAITLAGDVDIIISGLTSPAAAGNYAWTVADSDGVFGANFQYVGDTAVPDANEVRVTAIVPLTLSFLIAETADGTTPTNVCDLGVQSTTAVSTCDYRLVVGTNAKDGYTIYYNDEQNNLSAGLYNGSYKMTPAAGAALVAGTEGYGANVTAGAATGGTVTIGASMNATDPVSYEDTTGTVAVVTSDGPNDPTTTETTNSSTVTHQLAIGAATEVGSYVQEITYTVAPDF